MVAPFHPIWPTLPHIKLTACTHRLMHAETLANICTCSVRKPSEKKNLLPASKSWLEDSLRIRNLKIALYLVMSNISDSKLTTTQTHTSTRRPRVSCSSINLKPHEEVKSSHGHFHQRGTPNTHSYVVPMNHSHTSALPFISQTFC